MRFQTLNELDSSHGTVLLRSTSTPDQLILHPQPNPNDPNDPLRWPTWKKWMLLSSIFTVQVSMNFNTSGMLSRVTFESMRTG